MKRFVSLFVLAVLATTLASNAASTALIAVAQEPNPAARLPPQTGTGASELVDAIIVKYAQPQRYSVMDVQMTTQSAEAAQAPVAPMRVLTPNAVQTLSAQAGVQLAFEREMSGDAFVLALPQPVTFDQAARIAKQIAALSDVAYAEPDGHRAIAMTPNDPRYTEQWHYFAPVAGAFGINMPGAWDITTGSADIVVAVVDTGIRFDHPDLAGRTVTGTLPGQRGYDFVTSVTGGNDGQATSASNSRDADPTDPGDWCPTSSWHGTHVAGTIGAIGNNGIGVAGINWVSKILPIRALGKCSGSVSDIVDGMRWAAGISVAGLPANPNPARVINLSLGSTTPEACSASEQGAINEITGRGVVVVIAAGNETGQASAYAPGNCNGVITVAATDRNGNRASYSNYGSAVEISAPGGAGSGKTDPNGVLSTMNDGGTTPTTSSYVFYNGTSMATPHVAGVVSLMLSVNPALNPSQVVNILKSSATPFPAGSTCNTTICGAGILNAAAAVQMAKNTTGLPFKNVYLPFAMKQGVVPPPSGGGDLKNGDFELGDVNWISQTNYALPLIVPKDQFRQGVDPHSGNWAVWLGGYNNEAAFLRQTVIVPANAPYLTFWQVIESYEAASGCNLDVARVQVNDVTVPGGVTGLCVTTNTFPAWQKKSLNLSAYANLTINLDFKFTSDSSIESNWLLDDVAFSATP